MCLVLREGIVMVVPMLRVWVWLIARSFMFDSFVLLGFLLFLGNIC